MKRKVNYAARYKRLLKRYRLERLATRAEVERGNEEQRKKYQRLFVLAQAAVSRLRDGRDALAKNLGSEGLGRVSRADYFALTGDLATALGPGPNELRMFNPDGGDLGRGAGAQYVCYRFQDGLEATLGIDYTKGDA